MYKYCQAISGTSSAPFFTCLSYVRCRRICWQKFIQEQRDKVSENVQIKAHTLAYKYVYTHIATLFMFLQDILHVDVTSELVNKLLRLSYAFLYPHAPKLCSFN